MMEGTLEIPHIRLTKSKKKDSCDLCGERKWVKWSEDSMMLLCVECSLSNYFNKSELDMWLRGK